MAISLPAIENASNPPDLSQPLSGGSTYEAAGGAFTVQRLSLQGGVSEGVELLLVQTDRVRAAICPTRGMSLWKANVDGIPLGWNSPVQGPVHPTFAAIDESSGLGWLDGFDELMVRCGLRSFGAPDFAENGSLIFPLHGRVGNLPARNLQINIDPESSLLEVQAEVHETRFLQFNLRLTAKYVFSMGESTIGIADTVLNASATPTTMQMLYHINIGDPVLEEGSKVDVSAGKVVARDAHAASDLETWPIYPGPVAGYEEQVYFFAGKANEEGWARAVVANAADSQGVSVRYKTDTLPYFTQWKNTVAREDGFVTGLEPGTGFPNQRSFEEEKGRVVSLGPRESVEFNVRIDGLSEAQQVAAARKEIEELTGGRVAASAFDTHWCTPR